MYVQGPIRRYRVSYMEYGERGQYAKRESEFRSLRQAADFCLELFRDEHKSFDRITPVEYVTLTDQEATVLEFLTDGKVRRGA